MKIVVDDKDGINALVASITDELVRTKPTASIAFAVGTTQEGFFKALAESHGADYSRINAFSVAEFVGNRDYSKSAQYYLETALYSKLGIRNIYAPSSEAPENYDKEIEACGGLDLVLLGIGTNGHIGYNEPATLFDTYTHVAQLTDKTRAMKAPAFGGIENVPTHAVTMGLKTICSAKNVILTAFGEEKAQIIHSLVYGKTSTYVPAAMLQMHMNMTLCLDAAAASKLD